MSKSSFEFVLNGERVRVDGAAPTMTVLQYLRGSGRTGSKEGCAEGDCGACTIAIVDVNARGERTFRAINSCIALLPMLAGREVVTVEGVGAGHHSGLHPVQRAMVNHYGSQCGYCTPGFVVSMFEAYNRDETLGLPQVADQLCGNLCRCTGYRPIRDAMLEALAEKPTHAPDLHQISLKRKADALVGLDYEADGARFLRPTSLTELIALRAAHPEAILVAGATEIGVELNKKQRPFPFLISTEGVAELVAITKTDDAFHIGGAANLVALEESLAREFPAIDKMLVVFASRQIRARATVAGNLVTASPIGDLAPVLLAHDARLVLASVRGERTIALSDFFVAYRKTLLQADEIVKSIVLPRVSSDVRSRRLAVSYKVSKRRELDISIVAAGFVIDRDSSEGVITSARLAFGGVAATPLRATRTEAFLCGKPWSASTVAEAAALLGKELAPIDDVRSGAAYRRGLVASLLEKAFLGVESESQDAPLGFVRGDVMETPSDGRDLRHESAVAHVTGAAQYVDDQAQKRPMLDLWPIVAKVARGRILRRDATAARAMPGVVDVLLAEDIPGENDVGAIRKDEPLLAKDEVLFHGQMIGVVIATSIEAARNAAAKVIVEVEETPAILGIRAAIAAQSFHTEPHVIRRGDATSAIAKAPHRLAGEIDIGGQEHFYLEAHAAWAEAGDDGDVRIVSSTQHPSEVQAVVSHVLHIARNRVVVEAPRMGGGFGGKETQGNAFAALVALAARRNHKPVRVQLDRDVDMFLTGKRHPFFARWEVGFDGDGQVLGMRCDLVADGGYALDLSESISDRALFHLDNSYYLPEVLFSTRVAKTNVTSHTAFRGFGGPQGMVVTEDVLDRIARTLGLDPEVVRERNLYRGVGASNTTHYGQELGDERIPQIWAALTDDAKLAERRGEIAHWNAAHRGVKRGIAITPVKFGISFTASFLNQAGALVLIYRDGTAQVNHGGTEMGQGLYTKLQGVAMRELGLPAAAVRVMKTQTDKVPNTSATAASSGSDLNGAAVKAACDILRERLALVAADVLKASPEELRFANGEVTVGSRTLGFAALVEIAYLRQVPLSATGFYKTPNLAYDKKTGAGRPFHYFAYGAAVAEVEVDGFSGMKRVLRVDILHDVGTSLNPAIDRGQIEGGFVQGVGWLTGEELKWDAKGRLLTHSASTYQIPAISDAPVDFRVNLLRNAPQTNVIHGSKAVGEPPLMLAMAVREAIRDAVAAFGEPGGVVDLPCPATHEAIFHAVKARTDRRAIEADEVAAE